MGETPEQENGCVRPLIEVSAASFVNAAFHQNSIPFLRELRIIGTGISEDLRELTLSLSSQPEFLKAKCWNISFLPKDGIVRLSDLDVTLDGGLLAGLTEALSGRVTFSLAQNGEELSCREIDARLLAPDEWGGLSTLPEILAAFVRPNDPAVETVLKAAAEALRRSGKQPGLEGYQSGKRERVWEIAAAIWSAVCGLRIDYVVPPASFETTGQKIRSPFRIVEKRIATCLDLALLFASCLEQAGLNPIVVLSKDHAFAGCWLSREDFSVAVVDDAIELRKRLQLGELILFETTLVTAARTPGFRVACERGASRVSEAGEADVELAIDVRRARQRRILPLPEIGLDQLGRESDDGRVDAEGPPPLDEAPAFPEIVDHAEPESPGDTPAARIERWKRRLLDLSLNNRLLNFRENKRTIPIECPDPNQLVQLLASGATMKILPKPGILSDADPRNATIFQSRHEEDAIRAHALEALAKEELLAAVPAEELDPRLTELYRAAREGLEAGGANILYLAFGFLRWTRDDEDRPHRAPLLLFPVSLERRSVRSGFRLHIHEDESRFNPTLLQMLREDFALSIPDAERELSLRERGYNVATIWTAVRAAIRDVKGWEVSEEIVLSTFSFTKHLMWKDLVDRTEALKRNPVVRHLIDTPHESYSLEAGFLDSRTLDEVRGPEQTFCPLLADSSQLVAVAAAAEGRDFVLIGPPGTGKSQTIANIIAQKLADGMRVLFVSEKMAALDVVYRRLKEVGLGDFCLELHSNKARKLEVLDQLRAAWAAQEDLDPDEWRREAARLKASRDQLNRYVERLHQRHPNGLSAHNAIGLVVRWKDIALVPISWSDPDAHDEAFLEKLREAVVRLELNARQLGQVASHPLAGIRRADWSPAWQRSFSEAVRTAEGCLADLGETSVAFAKTIDIEVPKSRGGIESLATLARLLAEGSGRGFALAGDGDVVLDSLEAAGNASEKRREILTQTSVRYRTEATSLNLNALSAEWLKTDSSWFLAKLLGRLKVKRALRGVAERKPSDPSADLVKLCQIKRLEEEIASLSEQGRNAGKIWEGIGSDLPTLRAAVAWGRAVRSAAAGLSDDAIRLVELRRRIAVLCDQGGDLLRPEGTVGRVAARLVGSSERWAQAEVHLAELAAYNPSNAGADTENWLAGTASRLSNWREASTALRAWCAWQSARVDAVGTGLGLLAEAIERAEIIPSDVSRVFEVNYCRWWSAAVVDRDDVLRSFVSAEHEHRIEAFRDLDARYVNLTRRYIRAKLAGNLPMPGAVGKDAEWGILSRELNRRRDHLELRKLLSQIPTALTRLTPCLLMSPLSIAQYLAADAEPFDLVIFDEASQIAVWDAVGAIARGKQVIVVGDPKQLPPTSFFDRADDSIATTDGGPDEDLESILDELLGASLPQRKLRWHYRSHHESLVAFSNYKYYGGELITFPSPVTNDTAVSYIHVPGGVYERGGARVNRAEAAAVVAEVMRNLRDPAFVANGHSIGVVTFNAEQQKLIEDLLDLERRRDPDIETFFASSKDRIEPVFVKNLETVQGDERDIILFSIGFGRDAAGKITMNFGPLNKFGGERRLNVAITRARREMKVFGTIRAEDIDLARTSAEGVRDLKHFLDFAARGPKALSEFVQSLGGAHESPFELAVDEALQARGWQVRTQVGISGYRIDLGVVHPDAVGVFLAGVECDGATYHRSATARDRDRLRDMVLTGLGWRMVRTWSTDWWIDHKAAADALHSRLEQILEADRALRAKETIPPPELPEVSGASIQPSPRGDNHDSDLASSELPLDGEDSAPSQLSLRVAPEILLQCAIFKAADPLEVELAPAPEAFFEKSYRSRLVRMIEHVVRVEAPIKDDVLVRRVARAHGFQRSGARIRDHVLSLVPRNVPQKKEDGTTWFWPLVDGSEAGSVAFRRPAQGQEPRPADEICLEELLDLALRFFHLSRTEARLDAMCDALGLQRLRSQTRSRLEEALRRAVLSGQTSGV